MNILCFPDPGLQNDPGPDGRNDPNGGPKDPYLSPLELADSAFSSSSSFFTGTVSSKINQLSREKLKNYCFTMDPDRYRGYRNPSKTINPAQGHKSDVEDQNSKLEDPQKKAQKALHMEDNAVSFLERDAPYNPLSTHYSNNNNNNDVLGHSTKYTFYRVTY